MQQIAEWLERLNLGQYAQRFAENDIDVSVLPYLTDADLEKIGVSLGHRRKILAAIVELSGSSLSKRENIGPIVETRPQEVAERRQVTVMFSDLVGSTSLSARMALKTSARSSRPIRNASQRQCGASAGSWRSTWAMGSWCTSGILKRTRTTQSAPCVQGWSWSLL